jgi:mannitol-1-phosphate/altronate dehydrogenase
MLFVERETHAGAQLEDPLAETLTKAGGSGDLVGSLLGLRQIFPGTLAGHREFVQGVRKAVQAHRSEGTRAWLQQCGATHARP